MILFIYYYYYNILFIYLVSYFLIFLLIYTVYISVCIYIHIYIYIYIYEELYYEILKNFVRFEKYTNKVRGEITCCLFIIFFPFEIIHIIDVYSCDIMNVFLGMIQRNSFFEFHE